MNYAAPVSGYAEVYAAWRADPDRWWHAVAEGITWDRTWDRVGEVIERSGRQFVALRKNGAHRGSGSRQVYHAVTPHCRMALCSEEPGSRSGWAEPPAPQVTYQACLRRLNRLFART